ncbi:50S ribosomal protein L5 [Methanonatronarchaeum sp. AMET6-2]|uniref:50S ribosomal protein L5 n=1 Tax=Methanonatronarchaeum sp. AMET6-2 TaxID=2933293 RepID=UPI001209D035|nr:50S ribosomal protein L5 [Methanonatronarchaeum sp. AMET6-2]RZN60220.1 MAG: 50S ribosomal protein L5 [Methanonatronarchaeia archaeon]UOY10714.1 50S ribosomal protein L5 [Methanonatronarchaeum sp. AMET6-2]
MNKSTMKKPQIEKVVVNMGVGSGGEDLMQAEEIMEKLTKQQPIRTHAKKNVPTFGVRQGEPIGCKTTLRGEKARDFLKRSLQVKENRIPKKSIDKNGNFSFGIDDHTGFKGIEYDPNVGIYGLDVAVTMERPGYRVKKRSKSNQKVGPDHVLTPEDTERFLENEFDVKVVEKDEQ